ncbi:MAG: GIY-YIG nuclease family protein [Methanosarcina sp.]|nr:GIY-YIG nuclease family protein [Methanosarcina sp.]
MFYVYIIYSESADMYYVGHTNDPVRRLTEHNTSEEIKFTAKYRPWKMLLSLEVSEGRGEAIKIERFIKRQKSRLFILKLLEERDNPEYFNDLKHSVIG